MMSEQMTDRSRTREPEDSDDERAEEGLRFDDPFWDDAFCAWWDPSLRTCC